MGEFAGAVLSVARPWDVLFDALLGARPELTECVRMAIRARVPAYRDIQRETLDDEIAFEIERVLRSARADATRQDPQARHRRSGAGVMTKAPIGRRQAAHTGNRGDILPPKLPPA